MHRIKEPVFVLTALSIIIAVPSWGSDVSKGNIPGNNPPPNISIREKAGTTPEREREIRDAMSRLRIPFIKNAGQIDKQVAYYANTFAGTAYITRKGEIVYSLPSGKAEDKKLGRYESKGGVTLKESLIGAKIKAVRGEEKGITGVSYFIGNDPSRWRSDIPTYDVVNLGEIYNGIGFRLNAHGKSIEKIFCIKPGGNPEDIRLEFEGARGIRVNNTGELEVETELDRVAFTRPTAYQEIDGKRVEIEVAYSINPPPHPSNGIHTPFTKGGSEAGGLKKEGKGGFDSHHTY